jgi:hypothetical protein
MTDPLPPAAELNTWQEIAAYLGISVREAQNREKSDGMPVRRMAGKKARVWAYRGELDAWKASILTPPRNASVTSASEAVPSAPAVDDLRIDDGVPGPPSHRLKRRALLGGIGSVAAAVALGAVRLLRSSGSPLRAGLVGDTLFAWDGAGREIWKHAFAAPLHDRKNDNGMLRIPGRQTQIADLHGDGVAQVLFAAKFSPEAGASSDELYCFSSKGKLQWRYKPDIAVRFGDTTFSGPWHISDMLIAPGPLRRKVIWLALEHHNWRPGAILALDPESRATLKFVNAGHIYALGWTSDGGRNFIVGAGVNNEYACAALAVLDEDVAPSCSPQTRGTRFECLGGPTGEVGRYLLFPPSELTAASNNPYNPAISIEKVNGEFLVGTSEIPGETGGAIYRLSDKIDPIDVTFDNSWAAHHRRLSKEGKLDHDLRTCPHLRQPARARQWEPKSGWTSLEIPVSTSVKPDAYSA